jgi:hypothetical protein
MSTPWSLMQRPDTSTIYSWRSLLHVARAFGIRGMRPFSMELNQHFKDASTISRHPLEL